TQRAMTVAGRGAGESAGAIRTNAGVAGADRAEPANREIGWDVGAAIAFDRAGAGGAATMEEVKPRVL
ncbi:hypothetical protein ACU4GD_42985, partial [Cupriavidus basilensis]